VAIDTGYELADFANRGYIGRNVQYISNQQKKYDGAKDCR
jgi:hypothetical protein